MPMCQLHILQYWTKDKRAWLPNADMISPMQNKQALDSIVRPHHIQEVQKSHLMRISVSWRLHFVRHLQAGDESIKSRL